MGLGIECNIGGKMFSPLDWNLRVAYIAQIIPLPNKKENGGGYVEYEFEIPSDVTSPIFFLTGNFRDNRKNGEQYTGLERSCRYFFQQVNGSSTKWKIGLIGTQRAGSMADVWSTPLMKNNMSIVVVGYRGG